MFKGQDLWEGVQTEDLELFTSNDKDLLLYKSENNSLYELFQAQVKKTPLKKALIDEDGISNTYEDILTKTNSFANYLVNEKKIQPGDQVGVLLFNSIEFIVTTLALSKINSVMVLLPTKYKKNEIKKLLFGMDCKLIICEPALQGTFGKIKTDNVLVPNRGNKYGFSDFKSSENTSEILKVNKSDIAFIMFTSGTTGQRKGCVIRNYNVVHAIMSYKNLLNITEDDISIIGTPMYHITGLVAVIGLLLSVGGTVIYHKSFSASRVLEDAIKYSATFIHASPTVFLMLLREKENFTKINSLTKFICGSSYMPVPKILEIKEWLPNVKFHTVYGLTETTSPATLMPVCVTESEYRGSAGLPIPGVEIKIVDNQNVEVTNGAIGEVVLRGATIIEEYYDLITDVIDREGWLKTGDLGFVNDNGYLYIVDRKKDMINVGGEKVSSYEVEEEISGIESVDEVAVVAVEDSLYGEVVGALVKLKDGYEITEDEIIGYLKNRIASYKLPEHIEFSNNMPKTTNGKIDKMKIRNNFNRSVVSG